MPGDKTKSLSKGAVGGIARSAGTFAKRDSGGDPLKDNLQDPLLSHDFGGINDDIIPNQSDAYSGIDQRMKELQKIAEAPRNSKPVGPDELPGVVSEFLGMLSQIDKALQGDATQSFGAVVYGKGDGRDSPATKASKDATLLPSIDFAAFMELMDLILVSLPKGSSYRDVLQDMKSSFDAKDPEALAAWVLEATQEVQGIQSSLSGGGDNSGSGTSKSPLDKPTTVTWSVAARANEPNVTNKYYSFMIPAKGSEGYFLCVNTGPKSYKVLISELTEGLFLSPGMSSILEPTPGGMTYTYQGPLRFAKFLPK